MNTKGFKIGDKVTWTSSSGGSTKTKTGVVEAVIRPGSLPSQEQRAEADAYGMARDYESYMVRVPSKTGKGRGKLYWPIANKLKMAEERA